ncbi:hypothetical protein [Streptomyces sp. URMC 123]|uniref:hypothetical protein n=1 Tax=Streptomyces sp. URMC 123 TaxID=3423403 RepID=UPI003F1D2D2E
MDTLLMLLVLGTWYTIVRYRTRIRVLLLFNACVLLGFLLLKHHAGAAPGLSL